MQETFHSETISAQHLPTIEQQPHWAVGGRKELPTMDLRNDLAFSQLVANSYARLTGCPLIPKQVDPADAARWLYEDAPFCMLAHNKDPDPRFIYANLAAQECFECSWDDFLTLPCCLSAEAANRQDRQRLLDTVRPDGVATNCSGARISAGRRFLMEKGTVWQLIDSDGVCRGQAALFHP
jgi:MEKHLA domain